MIKLCEYTHEEKIEGYTVVLNEQDKSLDVRATNDLSSFFFFKILCVARLYISFQLKKLFYEYTKIKYILSNIAMLNGHI